MLHELAFVGVRNVTYGTELAYKIVGNQSCGSIGQQSTTTTPKGAAVEFRVP